MKQAFIILLSLISTYSFAGQNDHKDTGEVIPSYKVIDILKDTSLKNTEAMVEFYFNMWLSQSIGTPIQMSYNGTNTNAKMNSKGTFLLKVKPGKYVFKFFYDEHFLEITTDSIMIKPGFKTKLAVHFQSSEMINVSDKPVIYVYPKESTEVKITMDLKGEFSFTYPKYENGWNFTADANGTIHMGDKKYDYLFWDGKLKMDMNKINWNEGFEVKREDQVKFFEDKLAQMGLSSREIEDYITYWVPRMSVNEKNYVHFIFNEEYNEYANLNVTPKPDKVFRVYMMWAKAEGTNVMLSAQKFQSFSRAGFTVVEWGGTEMNEMPKVPGLNFNLNFED